MCILKIRDEISQIMLHNGVINLPQVTFDLEIAEGSVGVVRITVVLPESVEQKVYSNLL
jgi:hypothetical protein